MKRRFFMLVWWGTTLFLAFSLFSMYSYLTAMEYVDGDIGRVLYAKRILLFGFITVLYASCFIAYGKPYRPPRQIDFD